MRRVREGDLDHLVFYLLQSNRFTRFPSIEPALSAKALVESLSDTERAAFLKEPGTAVPRIPDPVVRRVDDLVQSLDRPGSDPRLTYFRSLVDAQFASREKRGDGIAREYLRVMRFMYEKEFVAQRSARPSEAIADLYRTRGLSTDTAVEAGFLVHSGLGIARGLEPARRIRRVLIVGPGLDLAPRTALQDDRPLESYQPWAVIDALLELKLADVADLQIVAADINPRVVDHLRRARQAPPLLSLISEIAESDRVKFSDDYREYFERLGRAIGEEASGVRAVAGHLQKQVRVQPAAARTLVPVSLDIVTERLSGGSFDLVVATNILPYFDEVQLALAIGNIASMLAPGGWFLHNETRPTLDELTRAVGLPFAQSRHAVIATVRGASAPLFDSVGVHRKVQGAGFKVHPAP